VYKTTHKPLEYYVVFKLLAYCLCYNKTVWSHVRFHSVFIGDRHCVGDRGNSVNPGETVLLYKGQHDNYLNHDTHLNILYNKYTWQVCAYIPT
jgi:hypothetical protein